ncbi:MAG: hypothetical protein WCL27_15130 [Betaproteobacteria bacterium]
MMSWKELANAGFDAFGNFSGGWEVGSSSGNSYDTFTNILNLAGQIAPTLGPAGAAFGLGLNEAAAANNSVSAIQKFNSGTLEPSDLLQITSSILSGLACAAVITGGSVPIGIAATIAAIGLAAGPFAKEAVNEAVRELNEIVNGLDPTIIPPNILAGGISPATNTAYLTSRATPLFLRDPLTLDLDGDGLETVGIDSTHPILFDHTGSGIKTATGWIKSDDAFLVLDRNGNGSIDNGQELFGDSTPLTSGGTASDGFAALAQEDTNGDGLVNAADAHWSSLRLWRDLNQDGISQSNELFTLDSQNIAALKVGSVDHAQTLANGNQIADLGGFVRSDGSTGTLGAVEQLGDINLANNPFFSDFTDPLPLTEQALALPDMQGAGLVRDLRQAASLQTPQGDTLANELATLSPTLTRPQMMAKMDGLLDAWADTSTLKTSSENARDKGYTIAYLPPGMSIADYLAATNGALDGSGGTGSGGGSTGVIYTASELERLQALQAKEQHIESMLGILERFNGLSFFTVTDTAAVNGTGHAFLVESIGNPTPSGAGGATGVTSEASRYAFVQINVAQLSLLEQSYAQLKESVYGALAPQTRLKPYLDDISLSIYANGNRLDNNAMEAANGFELRNAA